LFGFAIFFDAYNVAHLTASQFIDKTSKLFAQLFSVTGISLVVSISLTIIVGLIREAVKCEN
jgi:hypothetical protein